HTHIESTYRLNKSAGPLNGGEMQQPRTGRHIATDKFGEEYRGSSRRTHISKSNLGGCLSRCFAYREKGQGARYRYDRLRDVSYRIGTGDDERVISLQRLGDVGFEADDARERQQDGRETLFFELRTRGARVKLRTGYENPSLQNQPSKNWVPAFSRMRAPALAPSAAASLIAPSASISCTTVPSGVRIFTFKTIRSPSICAYSA